MALYTSARTLFEHVEVIPLLLPASPIFFQIHRALSIVSTPQSSTTKQYISLAPWRIIFNLRAIGKRTKYVLPTGGIDEIDLCVGGIEVHPHLPPVSHLGQSHIPKSVLCVEKSSVGQQIILSRSVTNQKGSLVIVIPSIMPGQVMNETYNVGSPSMKILKIMSM